MDAIKIFAGLSKHLYVCLRYRKHCGGSVEIVVVVCGLICGNRCGKMEKNVGLEQKLVW